MDKICFLFGHSYAPESVLPELEREIERHYTQRGVRRFVVGKHGGFDMLAIKALKSAKKKHEDMELYLLLHYHPAERSVDIPKDFDGSIYPDGMETVPRRVAIVEANRRMVKSADMVICYARYPGNSRELLEYARRKGKQMVNIARPK